MYNAPQPPPEALPSARALLRSTLIALAVATVLLVTVVLPAEYGIDPTGIGGPLGLTRMGQIKVALALEAEADAAADAAALAAEEEAAARFDETAASATPEPATAAAPAPTNLEMAEVVLQPNEVGAVELLMSEGTRVRYEWWTVGGAVSFEARGVRADAMAGSYHGYGRGEGRESDEGVLSAAFDGLHGWSWTNATSEVVTVTLRVEGDFTELRQSP